MSRPKNRKKEITKSLVLHSAAKLFIENGYSNTRIKDIAEEAQVSYNDVFRTFEDKDTLLSELVGLVLEYQFEKTSEVLKGYNTTKIQTYAFETVLQLHVAESYEHIREMYLTSYSLPRSTEAIYDTITSKLENIFKDYLPEYQTKDFFELEIASAGIMRGFISVPCDMYFTMDRKVNRFLESLLKIFDVDKKTINETIDFLKQFDFKKLAIELLDSLFDYLEDRT